MRELKRIFPLLLAIIMTILLMGTALALDEDGLENFVKKNSYQTGQFTDVESTDWFAESVKKAYELGLVKGTGASSYNPNGNVTVAEALTLACRLHDIFFGGTGEFKQESPWYQAYVDYAIANGIITSTQFQSYTATATRAEVATIMAKALPNRALNEINEITDIPDVDKTANYVDAVYLLYNAGILTGNDKYGTFYPEKPILRSEIAAIVTRMADQSERKTFTIAECTTLPSVLEIKGWGGDFCPTISFEEGRSCELLFNMAEWMLNCSGLYEVILCDNGKRMIEVDLGETVIGDGKDHKTNYFYLFENDHGEWDYYGENIGLTFAGSTYAAANMKQINAAPTLLEPARIRTGVYCGDENVRDEVYVETVSSAGDISFSASWYRAAGVDAFGEAYGNIIPFCDDDGYHKTYGVLEFIDESIILTLFESGLPYINNGSYTYTYTGTVEECAIAYHKMILLMGRSSNCGWARTIDFKPTEDMYMQFNENGTFVYWIGTYHGGDIFFDRFSGYYAVDAHTIYLNGDAYDLSTYTAGLTTMTLTALGTYTTDFSGQYYNEDYEFFRYFSAD